MLILILVKDHFKFVIIYHWIYFYIGYYNLNQVNKKIYIYIKKINDLKNSKK